MPYPAQVNREQLIETAWNMVEETGTDDLTLSNLAKVFGIRAPSLYRHVKNKAALVRAVNELTEHRLFTAMNDSLVQAADEPAAQLMAAAYGYRRFAHAHPRPFLLAFTTSDPDERPDPQLQTEAVLPLQRIMAVISGEADSLPALRGLLALVYGFVLLEINDQLRRGGSLDDAFEQSVAAYLRGWTG